MKKIMLSLAMLTVALSMVSCGGSEKSREDKIREKAAYIVREAAKASANQDWDRLEEISRQEQEFTKNFSDEDLRLYNEACVDAASKLLD